MSRYVISDHHFGHANIIEYCDRPFTSVGQMDDTMLNRYYETVDSDDILIHLGDITMDMSDGRDVIKRFTKLDGDLLVQGDHDVGLSPSDAPFPIVDSCTLSHGEYEFYCTHRPAHVPDSWDGWTLHGHHHNNDVDEYPFVHFDARRVNVSAELLEYRPLALEILTQLLDRCQNGDCLRDMEVTSERFSELAGTY